MYAFGSGLELKILPEQSCHYHTTLLEKEKAAPKGAAFSF
jgi:hypothetical protein